MYGEAVIAYLFVRYLLLWKSLVLLYAASNGSVYIS